MSVHPPLAEPALTVDGAGDPLRAPGVLQVLPALATGGVERSAVDVARALVQAGWRSIVVSHGGPMVREVERAGATHVLAPVHSKNPWVMRRNTGLLVELIRRHGIDIVHARSRAPAWSARAAARRTATPFVTTFHGTYNAGNPLKRWYNGVMARADRVIANSQFTARHVIERYGADPAIVVPIARGIDTTRFDAHAVSAERMVRLAREWSLPDGIPVVLLPGRLTRWKGQRVMIDAVGRIVAAQGRDALVCVLVGDDQGRNAYREELSRTVQGRGLDGVVRIVGHCNDMPAAYMLADAVVSASTDPEAFGRVAVEGAAMGRPVVATDHGAAPETVLPGETGWLVPPNDAEALAGAVMAALAMDGETRQAVAQRARTHVLDHYTVERMCAATLDVYAELLGRR